MAEKANHHFIPQFYLRNFSVPCDRRKAKVFCFDRSTMKAFETLVRNVGSRRHFFRIDVEGLDPNHVEDRMAEIEGEIAGHLAEVIAEKRFPSDAHFSSIMLLMGNMAVRNPRFRSMTEGLHVQVINGMTRMMLRDKERYQASIQDARSKGVPIRDNISYEEMRDFVERGEYNVVIDRTYLIGLELQSVPTVCDQLAQRNWSFVSPSEGGSYITSDDPVVLDWIDARRGPYSPGFGLQDTIVMFTIAPEIALIGLFVQQPPHRTHDRRQVAAMNTSIARYATTQIYARDHSFEVNIRDEEFVLGRDLSAKLGR